MSAPARAGAGAASGPLPLGTVLGARFSVREFLRQEAGTDLYRGADNQGGAPVLLRVLGSASPAGRAALEADLGRVAKLQHKNLAGVVSVGDYAGQLFVALEGDEGHTLRELIDAQRSQGKTVGPQYAQTLLGHVAHALDEAYRVMAHGGVNPACIWVTQSGRVKLADLGLHRGLPALAWRGGPAGAPEGLYVAPEVGQGSPPTAASDVYSMGAILYELVTGLPPVPPLRPPTQVVPDLPPAIEAVLGQALSAAPQGRFPTPADLIAALGAALSGAAAAPRMTLGRSFDVAHAAGMAEGDERWLIQKDRLDYGPFSIQQIMAQIERGIFNGEHFIVDVDSGERQKIKEHPLLGEFAVESERKLEAVRRAQAEQVHEVVERKKSRATVVILGTVLVQLAVGAGYYFMHRQAATQEELATRSGDEEVDAFIKQFKLDVPKKKATARRAGAGGGRGDEFSSVTNLGDVSSGGGDEILSDAKIQAVMMGNYRKLVPCIMKERAHNPGLSDIDVEFVVLGSGKVPAVRVNGQQRGEFPACILGKMQSFGFPSYNGKKTIASWSMSMR